MGLFDDNSSSGGISMWRSEWGNMQTLQDQLDSQIAASAATQRRLSSQISRLQGDLTQRVDRLTKAFDAFVELSEIREILALHTDARRWRVEARHVVESAIATGIAPTQESIPDLEDVPGYWLPPALGALFGIVAGKPDAELVAEAARRDEPRSTMFIAAAAVMVAPNDITGAWVARAMADAPAAPVSRAQRALWLAAADGDMGATAVEAVRAELRRRLQHVDDAGHQRVVESLASFPPGGATDTTSRSRHTAGAATEMLRRWANWCSQLAADTGESAVATAVAAGRAQRGSDAVLDTVGSLVEEGSEIERPLLDEAERLMSVVRAAPLIERSEWADEAGTVVDLLVADLRQTDEVARARFAATLLAGDVAAAADTLAKEAYAAVAEPIVVAAGGRSIVVGADGAAADEVAAAEAAVSRPPAASVPRLALPAAIASAVLFALLGVVVGPGFFALAVVGAAAAVGALLLTRRDRAAGAATSLAQRERLQARVAEATATYAHQVESTASAAAEAGALHREIVDALEALAR